MTHFDRAQVLEDLLQLTDHPPRGWCSSFKLDDLRARLRSGAQVDVTRRGVSSSELGTIYLQRWSNPLGRVRPAADDCSESTEILNELLSSDTALIVIRADVDPGFVVLFYDPAVHQLVGSLCFERQP